MKPSLFIGSSTSESAAEIVARQFKGLCDVRPWYKDVFLPMEMVLDCLLEAADSCHFGIFLFAAGDLATIRGTTAAAVSANVVFECGMFFGRWGRHRSFVLAPRDIKVHMPSDFAGVNPAYYEGGDSGIPEACRRIKKQIQKQMHLGPPNSSLGGEWLKLGRCVVPASSLMRAKVRQWPST